MFIKYLPVVCPSINKLKQIDKLVSDFLAVDTCKYMSVQWLLQKEVPDTSPASAMVREGCSQPGIMVSEDAFVGLYTESSDLRISLPSSPQDKHTLIMTGNSSFLGRRSRGGALAPENPAPFVAAQCVLM